MKHKNKAAKEKTARKRFPGFLKVLIVLVLLAACVYAAYYYVITNYTIKNVYVNGNVHYSEEEIKDMVLTGRFSDNSLFLSMKNKYKPVSDIPFVETIDVKIEDKETVRITVYEKTLAGFIEYLGRYIYFDKDGIVVESSLVKTEGVPEVVGVDFNQIILYEQLPAKDEKLFSNVLEITKLMNKYNVNASKMYFKPNGDIVLYKDDIIISLGAFENLDVKIMNLPSILEKLQGLSGTLRMENYTEETKRHFFEPAQDAQENSGEQHD